MWKARKARRAAQVPGLLARALGWIRGRSQLLVRAANDMPLLLLNYPKGGESAAREIEAAYARTLPRMSAQVRAPYDELWRGLPAIIVVLLEPRNPCGCLGHHHPPGAESRLARRLSSDLGHPVAEIDLAYESIRAWQPEPLSALAAEQGGAALEEARFQAAALSVLLHELEHLAFPGRSEQAVRARSREFYTQAMRELVAELGGDYGMASSRPR